MGQLKETLPLSGLKGEKFLEAAYLRYGKILYTYGLRRWKVNEDVAWEVVYKTIYRLEEVFYDHSFENEQKLKSFIFRIYINYLKNHFRDTEKHAELVFPEAPLEMVEPESEPEQKEVSVNLSLLKSELEKLESWQRILLLMRTAGSPYAEIAQFVDKPESQLKVYYQRIKEQLIKKLHGKR